MLLLLLRLLLWLTGWSSLTTGTLCCMSTYPALSLPFSLSRSLQDSRTDVWLTPTTGGGVWPARLKVSPELRSGDVQRLVSVLAPNTTQRLIWAGPGQPITRAAAAAVNIVQSESDQRDWSEGRATARTTVVVVVVICVRASAFSARFRGDASREREKQRTNGQ